MSIKLEQIKNPERFDVKLEKELVEKALDYSLKSIDHRLDRYGDHMFPDSHSINGVYKMGENLYYPESRSPDNWTSGFWSGQIWMAYQHTKDEKYLRVGRAHSKSFKKRLDEYKLNRKLVDLDHHDIGFLYLLSTKADYQLTKDEEALETTLRANELLTNRYLPEAKILQAWGDMNDPKQRGRIIIDCNLNVPLLYFASNMTNNDKFKQIADNHLESAVKTLIRKDGSTYHTFFFDTETGEPKFGNTHQGFSDESPWARGQAWGIMGFALAYKNTKDEKYLESAKIVANYFLNRLPSDLVCNWDLLFLGDEDQRDTSAAAVAAIGFLEIYEATKEEIYLNAAHAISKSLIENYMGDDLEGLVKHGVYYYHGNIGIDDYLIFGDYYFMELMMRLYGHEETFWDIEKR